MRLGGRILATECPARLLERNPLNSFMPSMARRHWFRRPPVSPARPSSMARRHSVRAGSWRFANVCSHPWRAVGASEALLRRLSQTAFSHWLEWYFKKSVMPSMARRNWFRRPLVSPARSPSIARRRSVRARGWRFAIACFHPGEPFVSRKFRFVGRAEGHSLITEFAWDYPA